MKKLQSLLLVSVLLATAAANAAEQDGNYVSRVSEKLGEGLVNVGTGFVEIPKNIYITGEQQGWAVGVPIGFVKGVAQMLGRTGAGVLGIATFYIPTKPVVQSPLVWENFDKETSYNTNWELYQTK